MFPPPVTRQHPLSCYIDTITTLTHHSSAKWDLNLVTGVIIIYGIILMICSDQNSEVVVLVAFEDLESSIINI